MKLETSNEFLRGAIAGSISAFVICLLMEVFERLGLAKHCWLFMAGQPIMQFQHHWPQTMFALLIHLGVGAFWGIIIAFLFSKWFTDRHYVLKSLVIGSAIYFLHLGLLFKTLNYPAKMRSELFTNFLIFVSYLIYGVLTVIIIRKLKPVRE